jgi:hypothetical protein
MTKLKSVIEKLGKKNEGEMSAPEADKLIMDLGISYALGAIVSAAEDYVKADETVKQKSKYLNILKKMDALAVEFEAVGDYPY